MKNKLILADGTEIYIENGSTLNTLSTSFLTKSLMVEAWDSMTTQNLKKVKITDENDEVLAVYEDLVLDSVKSSTEEDGTILAVFFLREKTEVELLREQTEMLTACVLEMSETVYA